MPNDILASWDVAGNKKNQYSTTIQGAINLLPAGIGGMVIIPTGTYTLVSGLTLPTDPVHIMGGGAGTILTAADAGMTMLNGDSTTNLVVSDIRFTGTCAEAISLNAAVRPVLQNVRIELAAGTPIDTTATVNITYSGVWDGTSLLNTGGGTTSVTSTEVSAVSATAANAISVVSNAVSVLSQSVSVADASCMFL